MCNGEQESDLKQPLSNVQEEFVEHRQKHLQAAISLGLSLSTVAITFSSLQS